jgi:hypothetical protein
VLAFMPYLFRWVSGYPETCAIFRVPAGTKKARATIGPRHTLTVLTSSLRSLCLRPSSSLSGCDLLPCSD